MAIEVEVVPALTIYMRDPFLQLKRKKGLIADLKKRAPSQTTEVEDVDEEEETILALRERKRATPLKRKQTDLDCTSTSKKTKVFTVDACCFFSTSAFVLVLNYVWSLQMSEGSSIPVSKVSIPEPMVSDPTPELRRHSRRARDRYFNARG